MEEKAKLVDFAAPGHYSKVASTTHTQSKTTVVICNNLSIAHQIYNQWLAVKRMYELRIHEHDNAEAVNLRHLSGSDWKTLIWHGVDVALVYVPQESLLEELNNPHNHDKPVTECMCSRIAGMTSVCDYCNPFLGRLVSGLKQKKCYFNGSTRLIPKDQENRVSVQPENPPALDLPIQTESLAAVLRTSGLKATDFSEFKRPDPMTDGVLNRLYNIEAMLRDMNRPSRRMAVEIRRIEGRWCCMHGMDLIGRGQTPEQACRNFDELMSDTNKW